MGKTTTIVDTDVIPATTETPSDDNIINCNTSTCIKDKILSAIDHIKNVRHKRADTDSIFEFISKNSPDVDKCIVISTLFDLLAENTITNKKLSNGLDSYKRIKETVDPAAAEDEQQLVVTTELLRSNLPSELLIPPQSHIDTPAIIHVGINDILRKKWKWTKNLPEDILKIVNSSINHNINKVFVSSILPLLRTSVDIEKNKQ